MTAWRGDRPASIFLAHAAEEEHLVVHREPEEDREHHHRDVRDDRDRPVEADPGDTVALLEHRGEHAVRTADGEQVHERCLQRCECRAERHQQQQQAQPDDDGDDQRQPPARSGRRGRSAAPSLRRRTHGRRTPGWLKSRVLGDELARHVGASARRRGSTVISAAVRSRDTCGGLTSWAFLSAASPWWRATSRGSSPGPARRLGAEVRHPRAAVRRPPAPKPGGQLVVGFSSSPWWTPRALALSRETELELGHRPGERDEPPPTHTVARITGRRASRCPQASQRRLWPSVARRSPPPIRRRSMPSPQKPRSAGSRVAEASTATTTTIAAACPSTLISPDAGDRERRAARSPR